MLSRMLTDSTNSGENIYGMMKPSIPGSMPGVSLCLFNPLPCKMDHEILILVSHDDEVTKSFSILR